MRRSSDATFTEEDNDSMRNVRRRTSITRSVTTTKTTDALGNKWGIFDIDRNVDKIRAHIPEAIKQDFCPYSLCQVLDVEISYPPSRPKEVKLHKSMQVMAVPDRFKRNADMLDLGDWVMAINGRWLNNRREYNSIVGPIPARKNVAFTYKILRPRRTIEIPKEICVRKLCNVSWAYEQPPGYEFRMVYLYLGPRMRLGLTLAMQQRSGKPLVTAVESGFDSLAWRAFRIGDVLLCANGQRIKSIEDAKEAFKSLAKKKDCRILVDRPTTASALRKMKSWLDRARHAQPEPLNPPMAEDVVELLNDQVVRIAKGEKHTLKSILRSKAKSRNQSTATAKSVVRPVGHVVVAEKATEVPIAAECIDEAVYDATTNEVFSYLKPKSRRRGRSL